MIKRKVSVDGNKAFEISCKNNNIEMAKKALTLNSPSYIDLTGTKKVLGSGENETELISPDFNVGDIVRVYDTIRDGNREKTQVFEGVVLRKRVNGGKEMFTVVKHVNGRGISRTWPVHARSIEKIEVVKKGNARRSRLNYWKRGANKTPAKNGPG